MTGFNDNGKFVPSTPKTFQVLELRDQQQEVKRSNLSVVARSKVINRSGSNYVSERTGEVNLGYGPMPNDDCKQVAEYNIYLSLTEKYSFKQSGVSFTSCKISGKVKDEIDNVRNWLRKLESGEITIVNKDSKRDSDCILYEDSIKISLRNEISVLEKTDHYGYSRGLSISKP